MTRVLITGGTGYVGAWCISEALRDGDEVTATIRDLSRQAFVRNAVGMSGSHDDRLRIVQADLGRDDGWDEAASGCDFALHVASPLDADGDDDETMVSVARAGTERVLEAAASAGVRRIVVTSSSAAAMPPPTQLTGTVDESTWTDPDDEAVDAYRRSKVLAERAAWEWSERSSVELATILPVAVFGPALSSASLSSLRIISSLLDGSALAIPRLGFEVVDVRDVARAHLLAMRTPDAVGHRFCVAGDMLWFGEIADILREHLGDDAARVPDATISDDDFRAIAAGSGELQGVLPSLGRELRHSTEQARRILGWTPRPAVETIVDAARYLIEVEPTV